MAEPPPSFPAGPSQPQVANPFLQAEPQLAFQEHHLAQGYQPPTGSIGPSAGAQACGARRGTALSARTGTGPPPGLGFRAPDVPGAPSAFPTPPSAAPPAASSGGFFSLDPYKRYFDVDTADVLHRLRLACVPVGSSFMTEVQENPDLYGPFWIAATLVFISASTGNLASYFSYMRLLSTDPAATWTYDIQKVSLSAILFYGYITFLPLVWYASLRYWGAPTSPTALVALYGYSLAIFLPISIVCIVPLDIFRWPVVLAGGLVGSLFLMLNLRRLMESFEDRKRKSIVLGLAGAAQFGLAVALKLYFFAYSSPAPAGPSAGAPPAAAILPPPPSANSTR